MSSARPHPHPDLEQVHKYFTRINYFEGANPPLTRNSGATVQHMYKL